MTLGGGAPREVLDGVIEADWSPDGSQLAISRLDTTYRVIHMLLEYPAGKVLYRPAAGGYVSDIRVSPGGDRVAFFDHATFGDDRGVVKIVDAAGRVATLTQEFWGLEGLAWERGGHSLLFSGADRGGMYQVHRATIGGGERLALPSPGTLTLQDVARDGAWLVTRDDWSDRLIVRAPSSPGIRDVSWLSSSANPIISRDGQLLAFEDASVQAGLLYATMIRKTDGSPVVRLGDGLPRAMSPDKRWVLAAVLTTPIQYRLYPTGAGQTVPVKWNLETVTVTDFFPDGQHLLVCGNPPRKAPACYRSALDGSALEQVTPDSVPGGGIRPDGGAIAYFRDGDWWIRSFADRRDRRISGFPKDFGPLRWRPDGSALWGYAPRDPQHLEQLDVATGRLTPLATLSLPADVSPEQVATVSLADDPQVYAYMARAETSLIFSIRGVR